MKFYTTVYFRFTSFLGNRNETTGRRHCHRQHQQIVSCQWKQLRIRQREEDLARRKKHLSIARRRSGDSHTLQRFRRNRGGFTEYLCVLDRSQVEWKRRQE